MEMVNVMQYNHGLSQWVDQDMPEYNMAEKLHENISGLLYHITNYPFYDNVDDKVSDIMRMPVTLCAFLKDETRKIKGLLNTDIRRYVDTSSNDGLYNLLDSVGTSPDDESYGIYDFKSCHWYEYLFPCTDIIIGGNMEVIAAHPLLVRNEITALSQDDVINLYERAAGRGMSPGMMFYAEHMDHDTLAGTFRRIIGDYPDVFDFEDTIDDMIERAMEANHR